MDSLDEQPNEKAPANSAPAGDGSVAHQIIGGFLTDLAQEKGYAEIAKRLEYAIFKAKPNEQSLRIAILGEDSL